VLKNKKNPLKMKEMMEDFPASQNMSSCDVLKCVVLPDSLVKSLQTK
jgi:hypothetical protein